MTETHGGRRRLAAVWFADIVGYTSLSAQNEDAALQVVGELQSIARAAVEARGGRVVKFIGDAVLTVFDSADSALHAALEMQETFRSSESVRTYGVALRVGVHLGEVMEAEDGDVYGDGVNVASRVEGAAEPGQVAATEAVQQLIRNRPHFVATPMAERTTLKGIAEPVQLYTVTLAGADAPAPGVRRAVAKPAPKKQAGRARAIGIGTGTALVAFVSLSIFVAQTTAPDEEAKPDTVVVEVPGAAGKEVGGDVTKPSPVKGSPAVAAESKPPESKPAEAAPAEAAPPQPAAPATGMWRVEEGTDLLDDSKSITLTLPAARGPAASLVVGCASRRLDVQLRWARPLTDAALRVRLDEGRDRDDRSQWTLLPDSMGVVYRGDARRFLRDLLDAKTWVAQAHTRSGDEAAQFRVTGLDKAAVAVRTGCSF